jgi:hypothetical protein
LETYKLGVNDVTKVNEDVTSQRVLELDQKVDRRRELLDNAREEVVVLLRSEHAHQRVVLVVLVLFIG